MRVTGELRQAMASLGLGRRAGARRGSGVRAGTETSRGRLGALLIEDDLGLLGGQFFFAVGAGHVAERRGRRKSGTELPERAFALGVGVSAASAADQGMLLGHIVLFGVGGMLGHLHWLCLAGDGSANLSKGGGGAENK